MAVFKPHGVEVKSLPLDAMKSDPLKRALQIWNGWCRDRPAPTWREVDLIAFPPTLLPLMTVVDVLEGGRDYRYRFWGSQLTGLFGRDETGSLLSENTITESGELRMRQFMEVVQEVRPALFVTAFMKTQQVAAEKMNLRLPVCDAPGMVSKIITLSTMMPNQIANTTKLTEHLSLLWNGEAASSD